MLLSRSCALLWLGAFLLTPFAARSDDPDVIPLDAPGEVHVGAALRALPGPILGLDRGRAVAVDPATGLSMASVDVPGNPPDTSGRGAVAYPFRITVYEITNQQYVEFLAAVAAADPAGLFSASMATSDRGGIVRSGVSGSFTYGVKPNFAQKPVNFLSWYDSARYCNWLHNGKPIGAQGPATTEKGAYDLALSGDQILRAPEARYFIPSRDEWYKAAYYDPFDPGADAGGTADYWFYPTRSDTVPTRATANAVGDVTNPGVNVANLNRGASWNGEFGNVTTVGGAMAASAWGTFDLAGNVNEQTDTPGTPIPPNPPTQPDPLPTRRIRGGDFANSEALAGSPDSLSGSLNMLAEGANIGFRVAAVACPLPGDPQHLQVGRQGHDVLLTWDDPLVTLSWNVYRDPASDPATWGAPLASGVGDQEPETPGIQFADSGAANAPEPLLHYLVTAVDACGESRRD